MSDMETLSSTEAKEELLFAIKNYPDKYRARILNDKNILEDVGNHEVKLTKKFKYGSDRYVRTLENNPFYRHYKLRQTYAIARYIQTGRRAWNWVVYALDYARTKTGTLYYVRDSDASIMTVIHAHAFERFVERALGLPKWEAVDLPRDELFYEVMKRIAHPNRKSDEIGRLPLMIENSRNSCYKPIDDGYLVGYGGECPLADGGGFLPVVYYKTFLSHNEISDDVMEKLMEAYSERKKTHEKLNKI